MVDLISQFIKNLIKVDELLNKDWDYFEINKKEKKTLGKRLAPYIKAKKTTSKRSANCFHRIKQTLSIAN